MRKLNLSVAFVMLFGLAQVAMAAGGVQAGGMGGGTPGGMSGEHMSTSGQTNSDAQSSPDATRGLDRAQERMSGQGAAHEQATVQEKQQGKTKAAAKKAKKAKKAKTTGETQ